MSSGQSGLHSETVSQKKKKKKEKKRKEGKQAKEKKWNYKICN
jgi:hypothetical protein